MALQKSLFQWMNAGRNFIKVLRMELEALDERVSAAEGAYTAYIPAAAAKTDISPAVFVAPAAGTVTSAKFIPDGAVTQSDTDYLTLTLKDSAGNAMVTAKTTKTTGGSALAENTALSFTMDSTHKVMTAGEVAEFAVVNTGSTGKANPGGLLVLNFAPA